MPLHFRGPLKIAVRQCDLGPLYNYMRIYTAIWASGGGGGGGGDRTIFDLACAAPSHRLDHSEHACMRTKRCITAPGLDKTGIYSAPATQTVAGPKIRPKIKASSILSLGAVAGGYTVLGKAAYSTVNSQLGSWGLLTLFYAKAVLNIISGEYYCEM